VEAAGSRNGNANHSGDPRLHAKAAGAGGRGARDVGGDPQGLRDKAAGTDK
jgi:hypothetical protein